MGLRILFLGENWYGSCARACCYALRRMGHDVFDVDAQTVFPHWHRGSSRALLRLIRRRLVDEYNRRVLDAAALFRPDLLLAFKGHYVEARTLGALRERGVALYNYYPDTSAFAHGSLLAEALPHYDCIFYTKPFFDRDVRPNADIRQSVFVPHGYDPEVHHPWDLDAEDVGLYRHDVSVVATHTPYKEQVLKRLVRKMPGIDLVIWGNNWGERCRSPELKGHVKGAPLVGSGYAKSLCAARINLAIMSGVVAGASQGDETTTRTYEIPACGGFMLHERSEEVLTLFEEGTEVACFGTTDELAEKVSHYLSHPGERRDMARAAHRRCVPAYSYDNRMAEVISWHEGRQTAAADLYRLEAV